MRLNFEGYYLVSNSLNPIINNKTGKAFYDVQLEKVIFRLLESDDEEDIGEYVVLAEHLSKVNAFELELMQQTKIYIDRPDGITQTK